MGKDNFTLSYHSLYIFFPNFIFSPAVSASCPPHPMGWPRRSPVGVTRRLRRGPGRVLARTCRSTPWRQLRCVQGKGLRAAGCKRNSTACHIGLSAPSPRRHRRSCRRGHCSYGSAPHKSRIGLGAAIVNGFVDWI